MKMMMRQKINFKSLIYTNNYIIVEIIEIL